VDGVIGDEVVGINDSIWTYRGHRSPWMFRVEGQVGVIKLDGDALYVYHTETGEVLHPTRAPQHSSGRWHNLSESHCGRDYLCYHNLSQCDTPPEDSWQTSRATVREGWVKDPEGKHRLWVPVEWRTGLGSCGLAPRHYDTVQPYRRQTRYHQVLVRVPPSSTTKMQPIVDSCPLSQSHLVMFPSGQSVTTFVCLVLEQDHEKSCRVTDFSGQRFRDRHFLMTRTAEVPVAHSDEMRHGWVSGSLREHWDAINMDALTMDRWCLLK
jgi:hypothetical protein